MRILIDYTSSGVISNFSENWAKIKSKNFGFTPGKVTSQFLVKYCTSGLSVSEWQQFYCLWINVAITSLHVNGGIVVNDFADQYYIWAICKHTTELWVL